MHILLRKFTFVRQTAAYYPFILLLKNHRDTN